MVKDLRGVGCPERGRSSAAKRADMLLNDVLSFAANR
jgi:hypothetical protein